MNLPNGWESCVEIHPADWRFPAGSSWIAGWLRPGEGNAITEIRAWLGQKPFHGLHGLPRPGEIAPPYSGFSCLLAPSRNASLLRLEACDLTGQWREFFRTPISAAPDAAPIVPGNLAAGLPDLVPFLRRSAHREVERPLSGLADEILASMLAEPLNALPNPPFAGALEEPSQHGRVMHGLLSVTGWLTHHTAKITRLTAIIDPRHEVALSYGRARPDVAGKFPGRVRYENSAFAGQVDFPAGLNTPILLKIFAELDNGEKYLAFAQRFTPEISSGTAQPVPTLSGFQYAQSLWALTRSAARLGIPTNGIFRAGRTAWKDYPAKAVRPLPLPVPPSLSGDARPLRILVVTHNLNFEGAPRLVFELASFIHRQSGTSVRVISPVEGPLRQLYESAGMNVKVHDLAPTITTASIADFHTALGGVCRSIDWDTVDLVLANTLVSFWAVHLAQAARKPVLFYVHESFPVPRFFASLVNPVLFPLIEEALTRAQRVAFTANASRQVFAELDHRQTFRVLPSWLDVAAINAFITQHDKASLRAKHGFTADSILLLNLGTVCERKGQKTFIQAAGLLEPELRARYPDRKIEFVMVGARNDDFLAMLEAQVADARLQNVRFVPETRENFDFHRIADVLVCTSFEESSPRVLMEAATFGTPIVSTDVFGIPELLDGHEAWLVEPGDYYQLANAIRRALAAHFAGDTARARAAQKSVTQRHDERVSLPRHLALVRETATLSPVISYP
jgi:glycosyltransferase involved in cell wall biosynthesis